MRKVFTWLLAFLSTQDGFARLRNNPLGDPMGKLGNFVGSKWKNGIYYLRSRVFPTQRGTIAKFRAYKTGLARIMFYKQMNIRNTMRFLGYIGRMNMTTWIDTIWGDYITRHSITDMSAINLMVKNNAGRLFNSIPNIGLEWNEATNAPNLAQLLASKGDLEAVVSIASAVYNAGTGALVITHSIAHYTNGADTDIAYVMVAKKPILESGTTGTWDPKLFIYPPVVCDTRANGSQTYTLPAGLTPANLTAYLFFKDAAGTIGFSDSKGIQVT